MNLETVKISQLQESKTNPRQFFDKKAMVELTASVKESGIITPLLVRQIKAGMGNYYEIVAGARRFRAAKEVGLDEVPIYVREMTDEEALELQVIENDQRVDVHPLEQCSGYQRLQKEGSFTLEQLATHIGKSPAYVQRRLKYADLIEPIRKLFFENQINAQHASLAARLQPEQQKQIVPWLKRGDSAQGLAEEIARHFFLILKDAPFDTTDEKLVPKAGSCVNCPKRTGFHKALFEDVRNADTCTDPVCFDGKVRAFIKIQVGTHKDAVLLSIAEQYSNRFEPKHERNWVKAGDKNCPDTKEGVVVEYAAYRASHDQDAKLGQALKVCTNPKCKTHKPYAATSSGSGFTRSTAQRDSIKNRKVELRRRGLIFKELAADTFPMSNKDYRTILDHMIRELSHDDAKAVCDAMQWEPGAAKYGGKDYQAAVTKNLAKLTADGIFQWLYMLTLAESDLWFYSGGMSKPALLEAKAKQANIPLATIAKLAKEKKKKLAAKKTEPKKAA